MDPNMKLAEIREAVDRLRTERLDRDDEHELLYAVVEGFRALDDWLLAGGRPPEAWREGPDAVGEPPWGWQDDRPAPEGFAVFAHWSKVHNGVNVEIDAKDGLPLTVHVNDWRAADLWVGTGLPSEYGPPVTVEPLGPPNPAGAGLPGEEW